MQYLFYSVLTICVTLIILTTIETRKQIRLRAIERLREMKGRHAETGVIDQSRMVQRRGSDTNHTHQ